MLRSSSIRIKKSYGFCEYWNDRVEALCIEATIAKLSGLRWCDIATTDTELWFLNWHEPRKQFKQFVYELSDAHWYFRGKLLNLICTCIYYISSENMSPNYYKTFVIVSHYFNHISESLVLRPNGMHFLIHCIFAR